MVAGRDATFRFRVDDRQFNAKMKNAVAQTDRLQQSADKTGASVGRMGSQLQTTGNNATASAVNFQTATQGLLNLSTAAVQTFTSISNLDRANNRAKMSVIAVARAEDLLANKVERQTSLRKAGEASSQKYLNITKEIATATADLTVKNEKMGIEQAAVNDIYMLFAANIANVTISSLQTIGILLGQEKMGRVGAAIATKLHFTAMRTASAEAYRNVVAQSANTKGAIFGTGANIGLAASFRAVAAASKAAAAANPVLLAAVLAISAAFIIYESNVGGVKDALNSLMGVEDDFKNQVDEMRDAQDTMNDSLQTFTDKAAAQRGELKKLNPLMADYVKLLKSSNTPINIQNQVLAQQIASSGASGTISGNVNAPLKGGLPNNIPSFLLLQTLQARHYQQNPKKEYLIGGDGKTPLTSKNYYSKFSSLASFGKDLRDEIKSQDFSPFLTKEEQLISDMTSYNGKFSVFETSLTGIGTPDQAITSNTFTTAFQVLSTQTKADILTNLKIRGGTVTVDINGANVFHKLTPEQERLINKELLKVSKGAKDKINIDPVSAFKDMHTNFDIPTHAEELLKKYPASSSILANAGYKTNLPPALEHLRGQNLGNGIIGPSGITRNEDFYSLVNQVRQEAIDKFDNGTNTGSGSPALIVSLIKQIKMRNKLISNTPTTTPERYLAREGHRVNVDVSHLIATGNKGQSSSGHVLSQDYIDGGGTALGSGLYGPTRRVRIDPIWNTRRATMDNNMNRLRNGGTRIVDEDGIPLFDMADEGAVEGGFNSLRAFRANARENFRQAGHTSRAAASALGFNFAYSSSPSVNSANSARAMNTAVSMGALAQRTGLSFQNFGMRKTHRGGGYVNPGAGWNQHMASVIAFNKNVIARAGQIDLLDAGYDLGQFYGSGAELGALRAQVAEQDRLMKLIGLNRPTAFQIIDTEGRGREEIDDRLRYYDRLTAMSSGTSPL